jgi:hypothetical protein
MNVCKSLTVKNNFFPFSKGELDVPTVSGRLQLIVIRYLANPPIFLSKNHLISRKHIHTHTYIGHFLCFLLKRQIAISSRPLARGTCSAWEG